MKAFLRPQETISEQDLEFGLRSIIYDGICSQVMGTFAGGAFLVAFALLLGASNLAVGFIAALPALTQVLQIFAVALVEKTGHRKLIVVVSSFASRLFWFLVAAIPWVFPPSWQVGIFFSALAMYYGLGTISGLAWNSWMRDFIPDQIRGAYSAKRMALATAVGAALSMLAGYGVDLYKQHWPEVGIYSIYYSLAALAGLLGVYFLSRTPEPRMAPKPSVNLFTVLAEPFKDANFRQLLKFLGSWSFAINLAAPFFTVYMLRRLGLPMTLVVALGVASQIANILFFRLWGRLADRYSNKSVLVDSGPLFVFAIALWPFTTLPDAHFLTIPLLVAIHVLSGISTAGVTLCTGNIALELAPKGKATPYLASVALVTGVTATAAPMLAGAAATWLDQRELSIALRWLTANTLQWELPAFNLKGLDFLFILSFMFGLYSLHRLLAVKEEGEVEEGVVLGHFRTEVRKAVTNISNIAGIRDLFYFPYARLREVREQDKKRRRTENGASEGTVGDTC